MFRSALLARLQRLKQLDDVTVNTEMCDDDDDDDEDDGDGDGDSAAVNSKNTADASRRSLSGAGSCFSAVYRFSALKLLFDRKGIRPA